MSDTLPKDMADHSRRARRSSTRTRASATSPIDQGRRAFLQQSFAGLGLLVAGPTLFGCGSNGSRRIPETSNIANVGPLGEPDDNGLRLPEGFTSRVVARSSEVVPDTGHTWHDAPDGGAVFPMEDGGWVYVSNSEHPVNGGVGAVRFDRDGGIIDAYAILSGTQVNCAGGPTPWGTWMSCEEHPSGRVHECDPRGTEEPQARPALGVFKHEAVAVDPVHHHIYLTEDEPDGRLYRFTPDGLVDGRIDPSAGVLEVAQVVSGEEGAVEWLPLPDPSGADTPTRQQVPESSAFRGGEGIWYHEGVVYFTTKGDDRVWAYDTSDGMIVILYDADMFDMPVLTGVDNVTVSPSGDVLVAEDGGDMQVVAITPDRQVLPLLQVAGHPGSEITGPALSPDRQRLYFSSQRGASGNILGVDGVTYEVQGPFFV
ncbi:MAG: alkaline phosphatase PhoX [Myxococcota bacterium]